MKKRIFTPLIVLATSTVASTVASTAHAGPCGYSQVATSEDVYVMGRWNCSQAHINFWWSGYSYHKGNWDGSWGYSAPCDMGLPLARAFNANWVLDYAARDYPTSTGDYNGSILRWGGNFALSRIDELDGKECGDANSPLATTVHGPIIDNYTQLWPKFFYTLTAVERAGTILHEARHADGVSHKESDSSCPRKGSCDSFYYDGGANSYQVQWLGLFAANATQHPIEMRRKAAARANSILRSGFKTDYGYVVPTP